MESIIQDLSEFVSSHVVNMPTPIQAAFLTIFVTWMVNRTQWKIARQKAVFDLAFTRENSEDYRKTSHRFSALRRADGFMHLCHPETEIDVADRVKVLDHLNHYELIALGIRPKILDDKSYRKWMGAALVRDWNAASDFIERTRWSKSLDGAWRYNIQAYDNFERLARGWSRQAISLRRRPRVAPLDAAVGQAATEVHSEAPISEDGEQA